MTDLDRLRDVWATLGREDPLWAVLSRPDKRGGRWEAGEFLATGRADVDTQLHMLAARGWPKAHALALDFGCGAGRLSRALATHFQKVIGLDVSASMLEVARRLNADVPGIEFRENVSPRLDGIADASVDFIYSIMTLQHIPAGLAAGYVDEFFRVLAPGGVAVFQFVTGPDETLRGRMLSRLPNRWLNPLRKLVWRRQAVFEMHGLDEAVLRQSLARHRSTRLLEAFDDRAAGAGWRGRRWYVTNEDEVPVEVDAHGYRVFARASDIHIGAPLIAGEVHDANVDAALRTHLKPGATFLDVGANIGVFTSLGASLVGPGGRVIAVEPIPRNIELIERACRSNGFEQVRLIRAAASDQAGTLDLRIEGSTSNAATPAAAGPRLLSDTGATVRADARVLDDLLADLDRLDVVKIDIEGMEPRALRGLARTIERFRPVLVSEFHPWAIERACGESPYDFLVSLGRWYGTISVLHRDGQVEDLADADAVMRTWRQVNEAAGMDGRIHLDLLFHPRALD